MKSKKPITDSGFSKLADTIMNNRLPSPTCRCGESCGLFDDHGELKCPKCLINERDSLLKEIELLKQTQPAN